MSAPTTLPTQAIDHAAAQAHLPTSLPPTDQWVQAIAATFPPPAITNTAETPPPDPDIVAAGVPLTFPDQHEAAPAGVRRQPPSHRHRQSELGLRSRRHLAFCKCRR